MMIKFMFAMSLGLLSMFSSMAMEPAPVKKTYAKKNTVKPLSLMDIPLNISRDIYVPKKLENSEKVKKSDKKLAANKDEQDQLLTLRMQELNEKFAKADEFKLYEITVSDKRQKFLDSLEYDHDSFCGFDEDNKFEDIDFSEFAFQDNDQVQEPRTYNKKECTETDPAERLRFYLKNKQGKNLDALLSAEKNDAFVKQPLVIYLKDIKAAQCSDFRNCKGINKGDLEYALYFLAKKGNNKAFIAAYLQSFVIKRIVKEQKKNSAIIVGRSRCKGWDLECKDGDSCHHSVQLPDGLMYRRFVNMRLSGQDVLNRQTSLTIAASKIKKDVPWSIKPEGQYVLRTYLPTQELLSKKINTMPMISIVSCKNTPHGRYESINFAPIKK